MTVQQRHRLAQTNWCCKDWERLESGPTKSPAELLVTEVVTPLLTTT